MIQQMMNILVVRLNDVISDEVTDNLIGRYLS